MGQRAKMSQSVPYEQDGRGCWGEGALMELRAILAETEPACGCPFDHLYGRCRGAYMTPSETRSFIGEASALAESLASFLAE